MADLRCVRLQYTAAGYSFHVTVRAEEVHKADGNNVAVSKSHLTVFSVTGFPRLKSSVIFNYL